MGKDGNEEGIGINQNGGMAGDCIDHTHIEKGELNHKEEGIKQMIFKLPFFHSEGNRAYPAPQKNAQAPYNKTNTGHG